MTTNTVTQWARSNPFNQLRYSLSPVALPGDVDYIPEPEIVYDDYGNVVTVQHDIVYFSHPGQLPDSTLREQLAYKIQSSYPYRAMSRFANGVQTVPFAAMMFVGVLAYLLHAFFGRFIMPRQMESLFDLIRLVFYLPIGLTLIVLFLFPLVFLPYALYWFAAAWFVTLWFRFGKKINTAIRLRRGPKYLASKARGYFAKVKSKKNKRRIR